MLEEYFLNNTEEKSQTKLFPEEIHLNQSNFPFIENELETDSVNITSFSYIYTISFIVSLSNF